MMDNAHCIGENKDLICDRLANAFNKDLIDI